MPVTLPAHPAAILPLRRHAPSLPLNALIVGSAVPDLSYALGMYGTLSHSDLGLVVFCPLVGLATYLWLEALFLPLLRRTLPVVGGIDLARFAISDGRPFSARELFHVLAAVELGAITHLLWDGLTHRSRWPASVLLAVAPHDLQATIAGSLQVGCSVVGSVIVLLAMARAYPRLPAVEGPRSASWWTWWAPVGLAFVAAFLWRGSHHPFTPSPLMVLWYRFWAGVSAALIVSTLAAFLSRLLPPRASVADRVEPLARENDPA